MANIASTKPNSNIVTLYRDIRSNGFTRRAPLDAHFDVARSPGGQIVPSLDTPSLIRSFISRVRFHPALEPAQRLLQQSFDALSFFNSTIETTTYNDQRFRIENTSISPLLLNLTSSNNVIRTWMLSSIIASVISTKTPNKPLMTILEAVREEIGTNSKARSATLLAIHRTCVHHLVRGDYESDFLFHVGDTKETLAIENYANDPQLRDTLRGAFHTLVNELSTYLGGDGHVPSENTATLLEELLLGDLLV